MKLKLNIQMFSDGKIVIETELKVKDFEEGISKMKSIAKKGSDAVESSYKKLGDTIIKQKEDLSKLKEEYASAVLEQGKSSDRAKELKAKYESLNNSIKANEKTLNDSTSALEKTSKKSDLLKNSLSKLQDVAGKAFKTVATGVGLVSGALVGVVSKAVSAAGELEQQIGGAESVFKSLGETLEDIKFKSFEDGEGQVMSLAQVSKEAYSTMGLSANDYLQTINKMGALMQGSGLETEKALDLSGQAMQRAADVASIMGIDIDSAMESIAGAAKGNFTMMDNLGVAMNATTIEAYAMSKGIKKSYNEMDNATKVGLAMEMFLEKTQYAAGNYAKENKTFAGSFTTLKASISNFLSGAGGINDVAQSLVGFGEILATNIIEMAPTVINGVITLLDTITPQIPPLLLNLLPTILNGAITLINGLVEIFPAILNLIKNNADTVIKGALMIMETLITTLLNMLPDILKTAIKILLEFIKGLAQTIPKLIPTIVDVVLQIVDTLIENIDLIISAAIDIIIALAEGLIDSIPILIEKVPQIINSLAIKITSPTMLMKLIQAGIELILALIKGVAQSTVTLLANVVKIPLDMADKLKKEVSKIFDVGKELIAGLWNGIQEKWNSLKNKVESLGKGIVDKFKAVFGVHSPSRLFRDEIGKQLIAGIGVGFEDGVDDVYRDMQKAIDLETSKMSANIQTSGTYQMAMAGLPTFNLLDNTENVTQLVVNGKVLADVVNTENRNREVAVS